jgi:ferritin-like metal-binding protein YciE
MAISNLKDVLHHAMKDLLSAEKQFRDALPKLAEAAESKELADAFREHREQTVVHIERLERGFDLLGKAARSETCEAAKGLVAEGKSAIEEKGGGEAKDLLLTGAGRKVEHYEIVSYADAVEQAMALGLDDLAALLAETLDEERQTDEKLHALGQRLVQSTPMPA